MRRSALAGLILLTCWVYWPTLQNGFVYEDFHYLSSLTGYSPEWLPTASALWNLQIRWDMPVWSFHAVNLIVHLLNGLLLWTLLRRFIASETAVLVATGVFLLHPIQTEAVAYVSGRTELVGLFWGLIGLVAWAWDEELTFSRAFVVGIATSLAVLNRPTLIVLLIMYATVWKRSTLSQAIGVLTIANLWFWTVAVSLDLLRYPPSWTEPQTIRTHLVHLVAWARYAIMFVFPEGQSVDHDWSWVDTEQCLLVLGSVVSLAVLLGLMRRYLPRLVQIGLIWSILPVIPRMALRLTEVLNEHQMYSATVGFSLVIAGGLECWSRCYGNVSSVVDARTPISSWTGVSVPVPVDSCGDSANGLDW